MSATATPDTKKITDLSSFTIEFGSVYNANFYIQTLREKFRGAWKVSNFSARPQGSRELSKKFYSMPDIPGMQMTVKFKEYKVSVHDPLSDDPQLMGKINGVMKSGPVVNVNSNYGPYPDRDIELDPDRLQTLVRELRGMEKSKTLRVVSGKIPTADEMVKYDGRILYDPASNSETKPKYLEDKHEWIKDMLRLNQ